MLFSTLRFALRRLIRQPGTTALHVGGLAIGLACCFFALLFVRDELSVDRFHEGADRIVETRTAMTFGDMTFTTLGVPQGGMEAMREDVPGVEAVTQSKSGTGLVRRQPGDEGVDVDAVRYADAAFLDVFDFPLLEGDASTALSAPGRVVLTESLGQRLFGETDPMGQPMSLERTGFGFQDDAPISLTVAGIAADPPTTTRVGFDLLVSGQTLLAYDGRTPPAIEERDPAHVRLSSLADTVALKAALTPLSKAEPGPGGVILTPRLVDGYLGPARSFLEGRRLFLVVFLSVAALVLLLACVNYANLATALALGRAGEVGVRKTLGAGRGHLTRLFLSEAMLLAVLAGVVAIGLVALGRPAFNELFEKGVTWSSLTALDWVMVAGLTLGTGLLAGAYPAMVLARLRPTAAFSGGSVRGRGGVRVRQALVVFQFAVTAVLLTATAVVADQLSASRAQDLGFEGDRVLTLDLGSERLRQNRNALKTAVEAVPGVAHAALGTGVPGSIRMAMVASSGATLDDPSDDISVSVVEADADYLATAGLRLAAGEGFAPDSPSDRVLINETAARHFELMTTDPAAAVGQTLGRIAGDAQLITVVGVVEDFHFKSLRDDIKPLIIEPLGEAFNTMQLVVQLDAADARALSGVEAAWKEVAPEYAFSPVFVDEHFAAQVREDRRLAQLFGTFGLVAILLACVGVFGLAAHAAERRTKEIGIRKVLGASVAGLVARLSSEFARLVAIGLVIAVPITVLLAQRWLEGFAYPAPLRATPFVLVGVGVLALALLTSGVHAVRAAMGDPVRALRSE